MIEAKVVISLSACVMLQIIPCLYRQVPRLVQRALHTSQPAHLQGATGLTAIVPDPWRSGFTSTAPVPPEQQAAPTAFAWLRKQQPELPLSLISKLFRQREVRLLQNGQVKRASKSRPLTPGDVLLVPKQPLAEAASIEGITTSSTSTGAGQQLTRCIEAAAVTAAAAAHANGTRATKGGGNAASQPAVAAVVHGAAAGASGAGIEACQQDDMQQGGQQCQQQMLWQPPLDQPPQQQQHRQQWQPQQEEHRHHASQLPLEQHAQLEQQLVEDELWDGGWQTQHPSGQQQQPQFDQLVDQHQQQQFIQAEQPPPLQQQQQQRQSRQLSPSHIKRWMLASSQDVAVIMKPAGVTLEQLDSGSGAPPEHAFKHSNHTSSYTNKRDAAAHTGGSSSTSSSGGAPVLQVEQALLHPAVAEALNVRPPQQPRLVYRVPTEASGAVVIARHEAAAAWLEAWVAGVPAAVAAATAVLTNTSLGAAAVSSTTRSSGGSRRARATGVSGKQQLAVQRKLRSLAAAAAAAGAGGTGTSNYSSSSSSGNSSSRGQVGSTANDDGVIERDPLSAFDSQELQHYTQLFQDAGGLRLQRLYWAVVQGQLKPRQTGTMRTQPVPCQLPALTRYKVLASSAHGLSWLELQPLTNWPNQIRSHCAVQLGAPIVGDVMHGYQPWPRFSSGGSTTASKHSSWPPDNLIGAANSWGGWRSTSSNGSSTSIGDGGWLSQLAGLAGWSAPGGLQEADSEGVLMLHAREVVLLRPRKQPVRVVAPLPRAMRSLLQAAGLKRN